MERLLEAWRADPRVDATVELCAMLIRATLKAAGAKLLPDEFVMRFASEARAVHPRNVDVAIAVTDLFLVAGMTDQARGVLEAATEIAPHDGRVHERLDKIGRRRRTAEFTARTADPETLDAPTTPLEPETEPQPRATPNPRRQHTAIGLPAAPPPLPRVERRTRLGLAAAPAPQAQTPAPNATSSTSPNDEETSRNEPELPALGPSRSPYAPPVTRPQAAAFGSIRPTGEDEGSKTDLTTPDDDDAPPTRVGGDTSARPSDARQPEAPPMRALPRGRKATMAGVGALEVANLMRLGDKPPPAKDSDDGPATRTAVGPRPGSNAPPPVQPAPRAPAPPLPPPPAPLAAQLPPVPAPPDSNHPASASRRAAVRRGVAPRPQPMPEPARPMGRPLDAGAPEVPTRVGAEVPKALLDARPQPAEPDEDDTDAPTRTRDIASFAPPPMRGPAPAAPAARPAFSSANLPPPPALTGARAQARPTSLSTADSSEELPTNAIPLPLPEPMPDPPTETQTAVRVPSAAPAPAPPPAPLRGPSPAARAASRPPPPAPPDDDDEDEAAITGLREVPPAVPIPMPRAPAPLPPPPQARQASVRPPAQQAPPMPQPLVQPVVRGGTAAMDMTGLVPSAFPATPPVEPDDDDDDVPRTHILNATEALAAARVDPRSPHAHSRGFEQPQQQQPQQHHQQQQHQQHHQQQRSAPPAATSNAVQRGMMVGAGATASEGAAIPPPAPSFGAPPPSMRGAQQPQPQQQQPAAFAFAPPPGFGAPSRPVAMAPPPSPHENYAASLEQMAQQMPIQGANEQTSIGFGESPPMQQPIAPAAPIAAAPAPQGNFGPSPIRFVPSNPPPAAGRPVRLYIALALAVIAVASLVGYATYLLLASRRASSAEPILRDRHAEPSRPS